SLGQVVELAIPDASQECADLSPGVDERRAIRLARVAKRHRAVRQGGSFHAVAARVAGAALAPFHPPEVASPHAIRDLHVLSWISHISTLGLHMHVQVYRTDAA